MLIKYNAGDYPDIWLCNTVKSWETGYRDVFNTSPDDKTLVRRVPLEATIGFDQLACRIIEVRVTEGVSTISIPTVPTPTVLDVTAHSVISNRNDCNSPQSGEVPYIQA